MMKAVIIEDEILAQENLKRLINTNLPNLEIICVLDSVQSAIKWLSNLENNADLIFMDIELSDGMCFDILNEINIKAKVIITTAYDSYAIKAFKSNCVDYLLKPIDPKELITAVNKCMNMVDFIQQHQQNKIMTSLSSNSENTHYKERFSVKIGDKIIILPISSIAYFYAEDKATYVLTNQNKKYIMDISLDATAKWLDPKRFFRINRSIITSIDAIHSISKHLNSRLKISLNPELSGDIFVGRFRVNEFLEWVDDNNA